MTPEPLPKRSSRTGQPRVLLHRRPRFLCQPTVGVVEVALRSPHAGRRFWVARGVAGAWERHVRSSLRGGGPIRPEPVRAEQLHIAITRTRVRSAKPRRRTLTGILPGMDEGGGPNCEPARAGSWGEAGTPAGHLTARTRQLTSPAHVRRGTCFVLRTQARCPAPASPAAQPHHWRCHCRFGDTGHRCCPQRTCPGCGFSVGRCRRV